MKITLYSRVFPPQTGGMERFAADLAEWLGHRGHRVTVVTEACAPTDLDGSRPYTVLRRPQLNQMHAAFREADLVHLSGLSLRGLAAAGSAGRRTVITHHAHQAICPTGLAWTTAGNCSADASRPGPCQGCHPRRPFTGNLEVHAHRVGARTAVLNICVSDYLRTRLGVPRAHVVLNPVGDRAFRAGSSGRGTPNSIAFAGRLVREKGVDLLLRALTFLPHATVEIAGDGPDRQRLVTLASSLRVDDRVAFVGTLDFAALARLYARASVVCVPSAWDEPFGYAAAEAMAMRRPIVATPTGALVELLSGGRGFLARDATPEHLAASLRSALDDPAGRDEVAAAGRAFAAERLTADRAGSEYEKLYRHSLS